MCSIKYSIELGKIGWKIRTVKLIRLFCFLIIPVSKQSPAEAIGMLDLTQSLSEAYFAIWDSKNATTWYEFGMNLVRIEGTWKRKNYSTWRYGIIYLTMYLGGLNEGLIQTVILSDRKYHQTGSKWTFIKVFQVFQDSKFSTKILNKIAQEILHFR